MNYFQSILGRACRFLAALLLAVAAACGSAAGASAQSRIADQVRKTQQRKVAPVGARAAQAPIRKAAPARKPAAAKPAANAAQASKSKPKVQADPAREAAAADSAAAATPKKGAPASLPAKEEETRPNELVEEPAVYPGGEAALLRDIANNLRYPAIAMEEGTQGTVVLQFTVGKDGSITDTKIVKGLSRECDKAAAECVGKLKKFTPAKQQGQPVRVEYRLPIRFKLS